MEQLPATPIQLAGMNRHGRGRPGRTARLDGKYLLRTSYDPLSAEDVALDYKQLLEVERGWRDLKHHLDLRPVYHRKDHRVEAHVVLCFLALMLLRVTERATGKPCPRVRQELERVALVDLAGPSRARFSGTELRAWQAELFDAIEVPPPIRISGPSQLKSPPSA